MWKASITSSSVIFPEDSFLHEGFHHENEPGCSGLGTLVRIFKIYN